MENFDVVIVGSGPAGSATAKCLTNKQLNVVIVEKEDLPRYKMCSGIIAPTVQDFVKKHFGEIPEGCFSKPKAYKGFKALRPDGSIMLESPPLPGNMQILSVWRSSFDNWLAQKSGAAIKSKCRFVNFKKEDDALVVKLKTDGEETAVKTKYLVGADGGPSAVRKVVNPNFNDQEFLCVAYEEHWTGTVDLDREFFYSFPDKKFCEFPMAAFSAKDDRLVVVTSAWRGTNIKELFKNFMDHLKKKYNFKPEKLVHALGCMANLGCFKDGFELGSGNVLLIGEAGGFMGGKTEGITPALYTGQIAAQAIIESIDTGIEAVSIYSRMVASEVKRIRAQQEQDKNFIMPVS